MPELPEVETVRKGLEQHLKNRKIANVELRCKNLRTPFPKDFTQNLKGAKITRLRRRAKYILIDLDNDHVWLTHLGMSGSFRTYAKTSQFTAEKHDHVIITLDNGARIVFNDPRRFGVMDVFQAEEESSHKLLKNLGLEPLSNDFSGPALASLLK
ncbi:MAG TPA: DNA-formamidopyrimidine glycosylase family protein, partial [Alphaproteobacteria bacterium]